MKLSEQIASHFRQLHFGENWTSVNMKQTLADVDWTKATTTLQGLNSIAMLVFHSNYYVEAVIKVLRGGTLDAKDTASFDLPQIKSQRDWEKMLQKTWSDAELFADLVQQLPDSKLGETFTDVKYGTYYRNLHGLIEHGHYHLGQIVLIKKILKQNAPLISGNKDI